MNGGNFFTLWGSISQKQKFSNVGGKDVLKKGKSQANPINHTHVDPHTVPHAKTTPTPGTFCRSSVLPREEVSSPGGSIGPLNVTDVPWSLDTMARGKSRPSIEQGKGVTAGRSSPSHAVSMIEPFAVGCRARESLWTCRGHSSKHPRRRRVGFVSLRLCTR